MIKRFGTFKSVATCAVLAGVALSNTAFAACSQLSATQVQAIQKGMVDNLESRAATQLYEFNVSLPATADIDPDLAIGGTIATAESPQIGVRTYIMVCINGGELAWTFTSANRSATVDGAYETGVPGVGVKVSYVNTGDPSLLEFTTKVNPTGLPGQEYFIGLGARGKIVFQFVKTGPIASEATVTLPSLARATATSPVVTISGSGSMKVKVLPKCAVNANTLDIDFGTFGPRDVSTTSGPTRPVNFNLTCSGPTPPASITATLAATPDTTNRKLIKNSDTGAQNLGIQLKETSSGKMLVPNDITSAIVHLPGGAKQDAFALEATVLRTGTAAPTTGKIDATATITLSIL
ncbi:fimbrial protein [Trinickia mobilis]|uniref:fimbrial protein n=1 Tax=Trinickia mobilis TaxID=2816356 RepID=UPI001A8EEA83|nr:fimbrial protein [Trinickia mobilis]